MTSQQLLHVLRGACADPRLSALTTRQLAMLIACDRLDWLMHLLAEHLGVSVSVICRGADAMVAQGLMVRYRQNGDKRRVFLRLTDEGRAALVALYEAGAAPTMGYIVKAARETGR